MVNMVESCISQMNVPAVNTCVSLFLALLSGGQTRCITARRPYQSSAYASCLRVRDRRCDCRDGCDGGLGPRDAHQFKFKLIARDAKSLHKAASLQCHCRPSTGAAKT